MTPDAYAWPTDHNCDAAEACERVASVLDSYAKSGYPDALIPKGQIIADIRSALDGAQ